MDCVVFDLDGTLVDTIEDIRSAINYALSAFEGSNITREECMRYVGHGLRKALAEAAIEHKARLIDEEDFSHMYLLMMEYYRRHAVVYSKPYDGIKELLQTLKAENIKLAILSNKRDELVKDIVNKLFEKDLFNLVLGQTDYLPLKPDPRALYKIFDDLSINKDDAIYIGDSEVDYKTAVNAAVAYVIVSYGFRSERELKESGIESMDHVPSLKEIEKIFEKEKTKR